MSALLADVDATCASLGYNDGTAYHPEPDAVQGLKHLIWILRRDGDTHEYRRYLGRGKVLQTDLLPMLMHHPVAAVASTSSSSSASASTPADAELSDVLLRLLVNLTNPALLLYREELPKDGPGRRNFLELVEILQGYKAAFALQPVWTALGKRLQTVLEMDWATRSEEQGLLIERILVLIRNVLTVPASPDCERRADNDASLHDQVLWALQKSGVLELVLYLIGSEFEHQYHLHALEIVCLMYREQTAESLADASLQRSRAEKQRDEQELIAVRRRERAKHAHRPPAIRHSRFGGTYVMSNVKSVSDNDIICHQSLTRAVTMDFGREKRAQKRSHLVVGETGDLKRRSAFSVRLFLREFCIEILESAFNNLMRQVRRTVERTSGSGHDDSYLLWALRFCMEFNRLSGFQLHLVSEALSTQCFHWVLGRVQHHLDMITSDRKNARPWAKRLHIAMQAYKELLLSIVALQRVGSEDAQALYRMLENNVCYVMEFRETVLHTMMNYSEAHSTKAYLADVVEVCHIFCKIMEHFCKNGALVQKKQKQKKKKKSATAKQRQGDTGGKKVPAVLSEEELHNRWATSAGQISALLTASDEAGGSQPALPEHERPVPYDAVAEQTMDDQKDGCTVRIHGYLRRGQFEHAVSLLRSAREIWPDDECFGATDASAESDLMILRDIFCTDLGTAEDEATLIDGDGDGDDDDDEDDEDEEDDAGRMEVTETDLRFEDFEKRLLNPKIVYACTAVLADWEKLALRALKSAVTLLHRISFNCKSPAMLYQASLFRVFQSVFGAPEDARSGELRRLATYIVRQFVAIAPNNPKVFAELLFYKSLREANDVESNYDGALAADTKKRWTEEQEEELRQLYMENQNNPETDKDVIDWIHDNLIDNSQRTRRAIIIKLKELGLIFKAPTKRSNALPKTAWLHQHDEQLRQLYDDHRLQDDALRSIVAAMQPPVRSKNFIIDKMIKLGLIAARDEILPSRRKRARKNGERGGSDSDDGSDEEQGEEEDGRSVANQKRGKPAKVARKPAPVKQRLDYAALRTQLLAIEEGDHQSVLGWLEESFNDAADDLDEMDGGAVAAGAEPEDSVPLVPFTGAQRDAIEDAAFQAMLESLGIQRPAAGTETYWRIPQHLSAAEIRLRARIVAGGFGFEAAQEEQEQGEAEVEEVDDGNGAADEDEEEEEDDFDFEAQRRKMQANTELIYNRSDDEEAQGSQRSAVAAKKVAKKAVKKATKKFDIFDMVRDPAEEEEEKTEDFDRTVEEEPSAVAVEAAESSDDDADVNLSRRPAKRNTIVDSDSEEETSTTAVGRTKRERSQDSQDGSGAEEEAAANRTAIKRKRTAVIDDDDEDE